MEHMIIGTAGHIDHGKTELIRALTGRDTDRLKEEKARGISIDLGFTWFDLPDGRRAGVIDVPGHEKFLPNMLAGACGMDLVLLVIAANEGIMPQTREHMDVLEQLDIPGGIVVLTKVDLVDPEWIKMMEEEIRDELSGTMFSDWPVAEVSSIQGTGIEELKEIIVFQAEKLKRNRNTQGRFRLPIDRFFSVQGFGTVITGTLLEGVVHCEDEVMIYPEKKRARVRSIQIHGETVPFACAGQRAALNIAGIKKEELYRGCTAAYPESLRIAGRLDVSLNMIRNTGRVMKNQSRLHLHIGTSETVCRVILLDKNELRAGETCYAQLVLEKPLAVKRGDRFIVRFYSPLETLGGGVVLDEQAGKHKRYDSAVLEYLHNTENHKSEEIVLQKISAGGRQPMTMGELESQAKLPEELLRSIVEDLSARRQCVCFRGKKRQFCWSCEEEERVWWEIRTVLETYHRERPYSRGMEKKLLKKNTSLKQWEPDRFDAYRDYLWREGRIDSGDDFICIKDFAIQEDDLARMVLEVMQKKIHAEGFHLLDSDQLYSEKDSGECQGSVGLREKELLSLGKISEENRKDLLDYFSDTGKLVKIGDNFYTTPELAEEVKKRVLDYFENNEILSYSALRDLLGNTKRSARLFMAYLDEAGITVRFGRETERKKYKE